MKGPGEVGAAFRFLTVLPVGGGGHRGPGTAAFPVVGLAVGGAAAGALSLPLPALARAALALAVGVALTGGLHEDAWADACDGALAPGDREGRLRALRDPRVGAHGATGLVVMLLLRLAALAAVPPAAVVLAAVVGRWAMVAAARLFPPLGAPGLGAWFASEARPLAATAVALAVSGLVATLPGAAPPSNSLVLAGVAWLGGAAAGAAWGALVAFRLGGLNGDGQGSVGVAAELGALWASLALASGGAAWWS